MYKDVSQMFSALDVRFGITGYASTARPARPIPLSFRREGFFLGAAFNFCYDGQDRMLSCVVYVQD